MWPNLPIEFLTIGTPVSLQAQKDKAKRAWQALVLAAAEEALRPGEEQHDAQFWAFANEPRLTFTMFYFPASPMEGDIDNIVKLTIDALKPRIYSDDGIIDRVLVQRFNAQDAVVFIEPSEVLLNAMSLKDPVVYIRIDQVYSNGVSV